MSLVHVAGPFQGQDYAVAELCIRHGVHYLDLADDAAFVRGIDRLAEAALKANVLVCSGASTAPAITGAVVEEALKTGPVERVAFGIMPGNDAPRGPALVAAILGGAGRPIADQPGRHVWGEPASHAAAGDWAGAGSPPAICRNLRCSLDASPFATPTPAPGWNCRSSMSGCGRCRGWCGRAAASLAPAAPFLAAHRRSPALSRHGSRRPAPGAARRRGQPRVVPDRRGRRRSLHPGDAGGGAGPQAGARRVAHEAPCRAWAC